MRYLNFIFMLFIGVNINAQYSTVKAYNIDFDLFPTKLKVQPKSVKKIPFPFTTKIQTIVEYNEFGEKNGFHINYRGDGTFFSAIYYNRNSPVYEVITFENSNKLRKIINKNTSGQFNGKQRLWFLDSETNKWTTANFDFENGELKNAFDRIDFPKYKLNFQDGFLHDVFYFYDNIHCNCFYYGGAKDGVIVFLSKITIDKSLDFKFEFLEVKDEKLIYTISSNYLGNRPKDEYDIKSYPIIVNNKNIVFNDNRDKNRIIFDSQMDFMQIVRERMRNPAPKEMYIPNEIDWSDGSVPPPQPYTMPNKK